MNTSNIKSFAKNARINLTEAVAQRIQYWGFNENGIPENAPTPVAGGYTFRGIVSNDTTAVEKWKSLKNRLSQGKDALKDTIEEVSYTWFNRLVAIKVLEKNGFIDPVLAFREGSRIPEILQQAKAGEHTITHSGERANLQEALQENDDEKALAILIKNFCSKNKLINSIFGGVEDYTQILLPQNLLAEDGFLALLNDEENITNEDYQQVELIGWLYQFYISDKKDEVFAGFKKNKKARPEDIPAATQIFTPKWIVNYMVQNTLGKTYLAYEEDSELKNEMSYLVETNEQKGSTALISDITELTLIDPACGSGHILVTGLEWLYKAYIEQGYTPKNAIESILEHNLFGLDIDTRAAQLARFAVLIKSAMLLEERIVGQGKTFLANNQKIPHIYDFPRAYNGFTTENITLFTEGKYTTELWAVLRVLQQGKNIGSALKITLSTEARNHIQAQYQKWVEQEQGYTDIEQEILWKYLKNYIQVALLLTQQYTAVVANPPYMGQKSMNADLKQYLDKEYPMTKSDLCTCFIEVFRNISKEKGKYAFIIPPSWLFLSTYEKLRESLIATQQIDSLLHLSRGVFGADFGSVCSVFTNKYEENAVGVYFRLVERTFQEFYQGHLEELFLKANNNLNFQYKFIDYSKDLDNLDHSDDGQKIFYPNIPQTNFNKIPGSPIAYWVSDRVIQIFEENESLEEYGEPKQGLATTDNKQFLRYFWEVSYNNIGFHQKTLIDFNNLGVRWAPYNKGGGNRKWYGNMEQIVNWKNNGECIKNVVKNKYSDRSYAKGFTPERWAKLIEVWVVKNVDFYFKESISWSFISSANIGMRYYPSGFIFDVAGSSMFLDDNKMYMLGYLNSIVSDRKLKILNPTMNFQVGDIKNLPVIISKSHIEIVENIVKENIAISKKDWDSRETSWDFASNPLIRQGKASVEEAFAAWEQEATQDFYQLHHNEQELNRIFIDIYGLQEELSPEVTLRDITILQEELRKEDLDSIEPALRTGQQPALPIQRGVVVGQLISYLVGVLLGRYHLGKEGLHIAHPNATAEELAPYAVEHLVEPFLMEIDPDAILPMMGNACVFPDDALRRIEKLIQHIWGEKSLIANINFIEECLGMKLEKYITEKFFDQHKADYSKKPIYWLFCSNPKSVAKSAFRVLVYMHRMDAYTVRKVMRQYLHPHMEHIRKEYEELKSRETSLSREETRRLDTLPKIMVELKDYNELLKQYADQQIAMDLDDGVAQNYAKFEDIVAKIS
ncbi:BREX-1 system adenine-specific DNA-methyltransferase PglX [Bergeyella zoohelcum]|uniref:BREX-1 system adenine-specific DNA-methyltransferase PglX n=1 Tax=Bergeyella zoohelcum TaxID=1015 RepID=UPI0037353B9B